jgi:beta-lactamase class A
VNEGKLEWTHEYEERLANMIRASSNSDASWGAEVAGLDGIESTMRDPDYCFYDNKNGGLWVGRQYGPRGGSNRDPLQNLSHAATARQTARFYTMLD